MARNPGDQVIEMPVVGRRSPGFNAVATAALASAIILGSAFVWIGLPWGAFWLAGRVTKSNEGFLFAVLGGIPLAMVGFGWLLYRLNDLYERLRDGERRSAIGRASWLVASSDERGTLRRARSPRRLIDVAM